jgi:high-affinity iron transporter
MRLTLARHARIRSCRRQRSTRAPGRGLLLLLAALSLPPSVPRAAQSQASPAKRVANIVSVAVEEYSKGVDSLGHLTSKAEYDEALSFLTSAREAAARLSGTQGDRAQAGLDSLVAAVERRVPPRSLAPVVKEIMEALGAEAALDMPTQPVDLAAGRRLYASSCASCHGARGMGDGPLAAKMSPPPPPLGSADAMRDRSPAIMYRIVSVGVAGTQMQSWSATLTSNDRWNIIAYLNTLRAGESEVEGQGLYVQRCADCHGATGGSNGALSGALSRLPAELSSFAWQAERSDAEIARVIRAGIEGTAMPPARDLTDGDVGKIVSFVRALSLHDVPMHRAGPAVASDPTATGVSVVSLLDEALAAARAGRRAEAGDRAFDAYIAFEPLETPARARDPGLVGSLERQFADFKGAINANDLRSAERSRNAIEEGIPEILALTRQSLAGMGAFFQSLLIIVREGFEAILVIGAIVAFLLKTGHHERLRSIWLGVIVALGASGLTAVLLRTILRAIPASREIIEGVTMLVAVAVLFSVSYWLISKVEAAKWQQFIREKVNAALEHGGGMALAFVAFLAVYREGAETALFYQALFQESRGAGLPIALGLLAGAGLLVVIFTLFYRYGLRIPLRPFFGVTSALLYYLAFVFMGKGMRELQEGNVVPLTVLPGWPHVEAMGIFPSVETLLAQCVLVLLFMFALLKTFWPRRALALPTISGEGGRPAEERLASLAERLEQLERRLDAIEQTIDVTDGDGTIAPRRGA